MHRIIALYCLACTALVQEAAANLEIKQLNAQLSCIVPYSKQVGSAANGSRFISRNYPVLCSKDRQSLETGDSHDHSLARRQINDQNFTATVAKEERVTPILEAPKLENRPHYQPLSFEITKSLLLQPWSASTDEDGNYLAKYKLAQEYFTQGLFHESLATLNLLNRTDTSNFEQDFLAIFLRAVNLTILGRSTEATTLYANLQSWLEEKNLTHPEVILWASINHSKPVLDTAFQDLIKNYPKHLSWYIINHNLAECAAKPGSSCAWLVSNALPTSISNSLNYYRAVVSNDTEAIKKLSELTKDYADLYNYVRSELKLVEILLRTKQITVKDAIERLENLRFTWRGDSLEAQMLQLLAKCYKYNNEPIKALRTYLSLLNCPSTLEEKEFQIPAKIAKLYKKIFLADTYPTEVGSELELISLFYEFSNFIPIGNQGDEIVIKIAKRLINLGLLDNASELLQHQIHYRLRGEKKIITADHLALVYIMAGQPAKAIEVLNSTDRENTSYLEYLRRLRIKAKAYLDLQEYEQALRLISEDTTQEAAVLKRELLFSMRSWADYIALVEEELFTQLVANILDNFDKQNILRLAVCYFMTGQEQKLQLLKQRIDSKEINLHTTIDFFGSATNVMDPYKASEISGVNQVQDLMSKYQQILFY